MKIRFVGGPKDGEDVDLPWPFPKFVRFPITGSPAVIIHEFNARTRPMTEFETYKLTEMSMPKESRHERAPTHPTYAGIGCWTHHPTDPAAQVTWRWYCYTTEGAHSDE